ncbi:hypothetical protein SAMN05428969_0082 [Devosia sp. YR412]|uniref:hypothetical protein n=1 Tax=Devosia sp. YR412 TaxID=1881030 RepID=UPI0008CCD3CE|nr:hypothetical protein [Devosia sp. YR412]SEP60443.1 hypothetical protein SAMN05428969_0082 [Devosia sp. YR412]
MKMLFAALALTLATSSAALAFDSETQALVDIYKPGKPVSGADMAQLMQSSEAWCYDRQDQSCAWREIYLDISGDDVSFELSNNWDVDTDYAFTDKATLSGGQICQSGYNWIDNLRAIRRADGSAIGGRELNDFKRTMAEARPDLDSYDDCFDYVYLASDDALETVTLRQRQYADGVYDAANDVEVTVYFDAEAAKGLSLRE